MYNVYMSELKFNILYNDFDILRYINNDNQHRSYNLLPNLFMPMVN